jgi:hypothetical protein
VKYKETPGGEKLIVMDNPYSLSQLKVGNNS